MSSSNYIEGAVRSAYHWYLSQWAVALTDSIPALLVSLLLGALLYALHYAGIFDRMRFRVDKSSSANGGELVADVLKAHGVPYIFTLCGGHISPILVACEKRAIRVVDTRHEVSAVFAADAVARLSGRIGVAAVTAGPGVTNTVTAVKNAQMAESALLLLGGAAAGLLKGRGALQDIDQMALLRPICKFSASVRRVRDIAPTLRRAIQAAQSGTPGPVFVELPVDALYPYATVAREAGFKEGGSGGLVQRLSKLYIEHYLCCLFGGAFDAAPELAPFPVQVPLASEAAVAAAAALLRGAKRPVLLLGSQAMLPSCCGAAVSTAEALRVAVEHLGIPCYLGGMSRGLLGRASPLQLRQKRRDALRQADVVLLAGAVADFRLDYGRALGRQCRVVAVNRNRAQLLRNSDLFWHAELPIVADVASTVIRLAERLAGHAPPAEWLAALRRADDAVELVNETKRLHRPALHLNPVAVLHQLEQFLPENALLVADGGDFVGTAAYVLRPRAPLAWLDPGAFGTLGVGGGFALGAALARPECDVWLLYGDGSLGYSVAELDSMARHRLPCVALVGNDACWSQIAREQVPMLGSNVGCELAYLEYETVAAGYGAVGLRLDRNNESRMAELFAEAQAVMRTQRRPVLINCLLGASDFREGSLSV